MTRSASRPRRSRCRGRLASNRWIASARNSHEADGMNRNVDSRVTRRELLKLSPLLVLGGFAVPAFRDRLLDAGVAWSDAASSAAFRRGHPAPLFPDGDVVPFERFPY